MLASTLRLIRTLAILSGALITVALAAGCGGTRTVTQTVTVSSPALPPAVQRLYGRIVSIQPYGNGDRYLLRFDPAWFTSGMTANVAQAEDQGMTCKAAGCAPVPNDNYVVDEGHRLLTFWLPAGTRGTVLVAGIKPVTITASQLAALVAGKTPVKLFEPLESGMWIVVRIDTVRSFAQQYKP
ncbi:MAG TPA: hypothetical protein VMB53_03360 [Gaiellaceae bacterium]|nr:hypothetical protein [Gaiellaceae bacterium]